MIEFIDNLIQLLVVLSGCVLSGIFYLKSRRQPYFLLCCFYGCFGSALLAALYDTCHGHALYILCVGHWLDKQLPFLASAAIQPCRQRGELVPEPGAVACVCG